MNLATINLLVVDPEKSKNFYVSALGMKVNTRRSEAPHFYYLESEGAALTMAKPTHIEVPKATGSVEIGFEVADIKATKQLLEAAGVHALKESSMHWGDTIETLDPDGHRIIAYVLKKK